MGRTRLSGRTGPGFDPCAAIQAQVVLEDQQEKVLVFTLGAGQNEDDARRLILQFRGEQKAQTELERVWHYWSQTLGVLHVETPDPAVNFLTNGWLIYQTLACRLWARTGFYQSGGAYGFRDQLQDTMALIHAEPKLLREHLLRACSRQFREGDVQHWWHPPAGRGVRTHFSDDFLWLPVALCRYVQMTGDVGILDEQVPFLSSRLLHAGEEANYDLPTVTDDIGSVYEHALRAIDNGLLFGIHGLPLMGCGDWNDGMNLVGQHGRGESVWLAFFQYDVLTRFAAMARQRNDYVTVDRLSVEAGRLRGNIELHGWDGEWYRRAYFDDGTPLGSRENQECQIDSISQSWSVLSGAGTLERSLQAMASVDRRLVRPEAKLIQLLDPPFDRSDLNPGYIKGYVPGVRENGGQYTHSAIWAVMAFAAVGNTERAWELFSMINPVHHGSSPKGIETYRAEPYVVAADVYGVAPHTGRGGWTWYTGSSGWMYRLITESLLGIQLEVDTLRFAPRLPKAWKSCTVHYRFHETNYHITIQNSGSGDTVLSVILDGEKRFGNTLVMVNDHRHHEVVVEAGVAEDRPKDAGQ
jgi:cyclic beta-1,2-glucan synthetase